MRMFKAGKGKGKMHYVSAQHSDEAFRGNCTCWLDALLLYIAFRHNHTYAHIEQRQPEARNETTESHFILGFAYFHCFSAGVRYCDLLLSSF